MDNPPTISPFNCPNCSHQLPLAEDSADGLFRCPACNRRTHVVVFPALNRPVRPAAPAELVLLAGEATCFYHPHKRALMPCDVCGRFLCAICDLELGDQHLCPQCLETGAKKGRLHLLERERKRWDQIVAVTLVLPLVLCGVFMPLTAVIALALIMWKWNAPPSRVANTRFRLSVYAGVAVLELAGGSIAWWMIATGR